MELIVFVLLIIALIAIVWDEEYVTKKLYPLDHDDVEEIDLATISNKKRKTSFIENGEARYKGTLHGIKDEDYERFILVKNVKEDFLFDTITEYGAISGEDDLRPHSFGFAASGDWWVIRVGNTVNFTYYHDMVEWFLYDLEKPGAPELSIGYAKNKYDPQKDYLFEEDPSINGFVRVGAFRNRTSFFIRLAEKDQGEGTLRVSRDVHISFDKRKRFIYSNGLDISTLPYLAYEYHGFELNDH